MTMLLPRGKFVETSMNRESKGFLKGGVAKYIQFS
jgi:hypothetical protein